MNEIEKAWINEWSKSLNDIMINIIGEKLGYIPLRNLTDDIFQGVDIEVLIPLMLSDGLTLKKVLYQGGEEEMLIYIK